MSDTHTACDILCRNTKSVVAIKLQTAIAQETIRKLTTRALALSGVESVTITPAALTEKTKLKNVTMEGLTFIA